jgi:FMN reductase
VRLALDLLGAGHEALIQLRDLPAEALMHADYQAPRIASARAAVAAADLVVIGTPIYQAAYSGLTKLFLDVLPQDALRGKTVLPLATGGSAAHLLALDYALKPVLSALGARDILDGVFAVDQQFVRDVHGGYLPEPELSERLRRALGPRAGRRLPATSCSASEPPWAVIAGGAA